MPRRKIRSHYDAVDKKKVDMEHVLELMGVPPESRDQNTIAEMMLPLAKKMARFRLHSFDQGPYRPLLDLHAYRSAAMEGTRQFAMEFIIPDKGITTRGLVNVFFTIVTRRFTDLEREVIGKDKSNTVPISADRTQKNGSYSLAHFINDIDPGLPEREIDTSEVSRRLISRLGGILGTETRQFEAVKALIELGPQGYSGPKMAASINMGRGSFDKHLFVVRGILDEKYPHIKKRLVELLLKDERHERSSTSERF